MPVTALTGTRLIARCRVLAIIRPVQLEPLISVTRAAFGSSRQLAAVAQLAGGSKKGVYRATFDDAFSAVIYLWDPAEDYWPDASPDGACRNLNDPFSHASGLDLFVAAHTRLSELGIRTPQLYFADASREHCQADVAVVEYVQGQTLQDRIGSGQPGVPDVMLLLGQALRALHADSCSRAGKLLQVDLGGGIGAAECALAVLARALDDLAEASRRVADVGAARTQLEHMLLERAAVIAPRSRCNLIHGELGPDHVLIDAAGRPVIVDIEGLMYFDAEWEHVFLQLRFGEHYRHLSVRGLDQHRLDFYGLAMDLSLAAGPLRLLDGDFPDREPMLAISAHATSRVLARLH
jgi:hypothetical protein